LERILQFEFLYILIVKMYSFTRHMSKSFIIGGVFDINKIDLSPKGIFANIINHV